MSDRTDPANPLEPLIVLDRLEVGPVEVTTRGLKMPYRVSMGERTEETTLAYRYEEDVFDPSDAGSVNLASMVGAQVALNYGLFCRELVFRGPFDEYDRRFLIEMAQNTACEIYVNKILMPNPLLTEAARVPVVRRSSYLQARVAFPDEEKAGSLPAEASSSVAKPTGERWNTSRNRVAVLSSGGKESLLSYGLLRELGYETHSLFVNESGRHWYTALNGYRHLEATDPEGTVRIWTNADRVFNWMIRRLPLVRSDFQRIRADEYPIRLWTVAVFLFGALPVMRKRGIARLVIGDEFDTTRQVKYKGIGHYDGLFDQSRFFDNALSLYYRRKRWGVSQFSLLRPLSELLVEKVLIERYPDLQRHQVSCHAASVKNERAVPCGRCEKCRRVVSMLIALGGDPIRCGYTEEQIAPCLAAAAEQGLHQEKEGERQLMWMLAEQGKLPSSAIANLPGRQEWSDHAGRGPNPEVTALRFDDKRSPVQSVPNALRRPLYGLMLQHADGAVRKSGRNWIAFDLINDSSLARPYRFEARDRGPETEPAGAATAAKDYLLAELTWPEAERRLAEVDIALLPVGAIEQHGYHLPLDTDAFDAYYICREVARRCNAPRPLVLPLIPYGVSYHHQDFPGTLSVGPDTLARFVYEVGMSAAQNGISKLVIINGHGGNMATLQYAAQMINRDARIFTCVDTGETSDADIARLAETKADVHAGEIETSTSLATRPELVDVTRLEKFVPRFSSQYLDFSSEYGVEWFAHTSRISPSGVLGDPTKASVEKGRAMMQVMIEHLVSFVEGLKPLSLAEIHEKRV